MKKSNNRPSESNGSHRLSSDSQHLALEILHCAHRAQPRIVFLRHVSNLIIDFLDCDAVELRIKEGRGCSHCSLAGHPDGTFNHRVLPWRPDDTPGATSGDDDAHLELLCGKILSGCCDLSSPPFTRAGSFFTGDTHQPVQFRATGKGIPPLFNLEIKGEHRSLAVIPLMLGEERTGLLILKSRQKNVFTKDVVARAEAVAQTIAVASAHHQAQAALQERVKELTCLYDISRIVETPDISLEEILERIAELLPPAWQHPEITRGRISLDSRTYGRAPFEDVWQKQAADVVVNGVKRGLVEVAYSHAMPELEEGPFLKEERNLIEAVALQVGQILERRRVEKERKQLQDQLRHADRLATIGQLAAGVAHEFNEPLGNILGFAELVLKAPDLPLPVRQDIQKIVTASLHAREVVKKLMWFARELPARKARVDLNSVTEEGLYLLEARCAKAGIEIVRTLAPDLPHIVADPAQLHQVLVNLVVNAIQAMPEGGTITIATKTVEDGVSISVQDNGIGMDDETQRQIFIPFFTTKDIHEGTGLGLPVVHGIVTSHGGSIRVESTVGEGSRFEIRLPIEAHGGADERNVDDTR